MTTQSLQDKIEEIFTQKTLIRSDIRDHKAFIEKLMHYYGSDLLSLFKQTVEEEIIGVDEEIIIHDILMADPIDEIHKEYDEVKIPEARNDFRASQRQKLQKIVG